LIVSVDDIPKKWPDDRFDLIWVLVRQPWRNPGRFVVDPRCKPRAPSEMWSLNGSDRSSGLENLREAAHLLKKAEEAARRRRRARSERRRLGRSLRSALAWQHAVHDVPLSLAGELGVTHREVAWPVTRSPSS
jgi:hypothetical protein